MKLTAVALLSSALLVAFVGTSQATSTSLSIGPSDGCVAECLNTEWSITFSDENVINAGYDLHVTLTAEWPEIGDYFVDENGVIDPTIITAVEFGLPGTVTDALITNPSTGWSDELGPLNGQGCGGHNGNFTCSEGSAAIVLGSSLTWEWDIKVEDVARVLEYESTGEFHIGARAERDQATALTPSGKIKDRGWLLSVSPVSPVPEPSAAMVYGVGLLLAGRRIGRKGR